LEVRDANSNDWLLQEVELSLFDNNNVETTQQDEQLWSEIIGTSTQSAQLPNLISVDVLKSLKGSTESLSARNLYDQIQYLKDNQLDSRSVELAFWTKIASPLATMVMLMLSLPFVFASQRSGGAGQKIFIGIMLGIVYVLVNKLLTQLALTNGMSPLVSAALPLICFLVIAILGIQRSA